VAPNLSSGSPAPPFAATGSHSNKAVPKQTPACRSLQVEDFGGLCGTLPLHTQRCHQSNSPLFASMLCVVRAGPKSLGQALHLQAVQGDLLPHIAAPQTIQCGLVATGPICCCGCCCCCLPALHLCCQQTLLGQPSRGDCDHCCISMCPALRQG